MKKTFLMLTLAALACGCQTSMPEVRYTNIEATSAEAITFADNVVEHAKQTYQFPQVSGMKNRTAEDSLNRLFKLVDLAALKADSAYINVHTFPDDIEPQYGRMYSNEYIRVHYADNDLISFSGMQEYAGGAHPSYTLLPGKTLAVGTLAPIALGDLFKGDYKRFFKQQVAASAQLKDFESDGEVTLNELGNACYDVLDALLLHMDSVTTTANMVVTDSAISILQVDFRDFGCPEVMRAVVEVSIPYAQLQAYINPKGYLKRFIK
jgi:hypothetical protein